MLATMLPIIRDSGAAIARLVPPVGDEEQIKSYLTAYDRTAVEMEQIASDPERTRALMTGKLEDPFVKPDRMAGEYGINKCSGDNARPVATQLKRKDQNDPADSQGNPTQGDWRGRQHTCQCGARLSLAAVITWLAGTAAEELYMVMALLAVAGMVLGVRARRSAAPEAPRSGRALAAIILGGALSTLLLAFLIAAVAAGDI
jgi:hypothetical protein